MNKTAGSTASFERFRQKERPGVWDFHKDPAALSGGIPSGGLFIFE